MRKLRPYLRATANIIVATIVVAVVDSLFLVPPFLLFVAAVTISFITAGAAAGLYSLVMATLASDFFFVHPAFEFSMNADVLRLFSYYALAAMISYFIVRRARKKDGSRHGLRLA